MSSAAPIEKWPESQWATRLIPGAAIAHGRHNASRAAGLEGCNRNRNASAEEAPARSATAVARELLLPHPVAAMGGNQLGVSVAGDAALTFACWAITAIAAALFQGAAATGLSSASPQADLIREQAGRAAGFSLVFAALVTLLGYSEGLYDEGLPRTKSTRKLILGKVVIWSAVIVGMAGTLLDSEFVSGAWFVGGALLNFLVLIARRACRPGAGTAVARPLNVLIVGAGHEGRSVARFLEQHPEQGRVVRGFLDNRSERGFGILGHVNDLARIARAEFADEVIVTLHGQREMVDRVVEEARTHRLDVRIIPEFCELRPEARWIDCWGEIPVVTVHREHLPWEALSLKRAMDLLIAGALLLVSLPVLAAIALLIRLDSPGPALYRAARAGRKGRQFECLKFRTMVRNADARKDELRAHNERQGPCFKIVHDPRITRVGTLLRRFSLDELPQLWNVVRGEMSLVGPRPHPLDDYARYSLEHLRRLDVTPGVTGLWQVTARQDPSFKTALALDLEYIERWSLRLDLRILWQTLVVVLRGTGV